MAVTNPWEQYAEYELESTVQARLTMARRYRAELLKAIDGTYKADGLEINLVQLRLLAKDVKQDIKEYERQLGVARTRMVPIRETERPGSAVGGYPLC